MKNQVLRYQLHIWDDGFIIFHEPQIHGNNHSHNYKDYMYFFIFGFLTSVFNTERYELTTAETVGWHTSPSSGLKQFPTTDLVAAAAIKPRDTPTMR